MGVPTSKSELLAAVSERFGKLERVLSQVPDALQTVKTMEGHAKGTVMSPADLVSYLIGWNELVLKWLARDDKGEPVDFPEAGYKWNELGKLAQKFYADYAALSFDEKRERLTAANQRIREEVSARSDEELYGAPWHGKWTKGRMIQFNTSSPYENARGRLRSWLNSQNQR
ncbi:ClbS/DfsB family four-helix bundle protein [Oleidesulfovibrio sp.]|uniref:ClbS/DfsB family four-helix bundle protein n=1 Tax=Oleidesulfovibrio sp. TaxID=2909707 RepID=UPI003A84DC2C